MAAADFVRTFQALTHHEPYPWQTALADRLAAGDLPERVDLPTGSGKTSIMALWLIALARQVDAGGSSEPGRLPRRLVWVVDRRTIVDQASDEARRLASKLSASPDATDDPALAWLRESLLKLAALRTACEPIAVSTLRGGLADNGFWKIDPARPSIVVGTVDMVGSRLLFSGYGDGRWLRPYHAGLLGQDSLIVLDEAHLSPAFAALTRELVRLQGNGPSWLRPMKTLHLSATPRGHSVDAFGLTAADAKCASLARRLDGPKSLHLHDPPPGPIEAALAEYARIHEGKARTVVVYVRSPESAGKVAQGLRRLSTDRVRLLTGTLRGYERDQLGNDPLFRRFLAQREEVPPSEGTAYLVATSAAEVGVDLDAEHMVGDLTSLESMLQRFGRVNRQGLGTARLDVIRGTTGGRKGEEPPPWFGPTIAYLESLPRAADGGYDVSVSSLLVHPSPTEAFAETPPLADLHPEHLDGWSMTSIRSSQWPSRPAPQLWLHGDDRSEPPETYLVWRDDIGGLTGHPTEREETEEVLGAYPVLLQEKARDTTWRIRQFVTALAQRAPTVRAIVLGASHELWIGELKQLAEDRGIDLDYATIVLPTEVGGLREGFLDASAEEPALDVADRSLTVRRGRFRFLYANGLWHATRIGSEDEEVPLPEAEHLEQAIESLEEITGLEVVAAVGPGSDEGEESDGQARLVYAVEKGAIYGSSLGSHAASTKMPLDLHHARVERWCRRLGEALRFPTEVVDALGLAGRSHDLGKAREPWQAAIGNLDADHPLAKTSHGRFDHRMTGGYRHEFGSLLDLTRGKNEPALDWDLVLHLVAAHHGYARPSFPPRAWDRASAWSESAKASTETLRRFARLTGHYGWYGLAYLESVLKAADALGSREEE